MNAHQRRVARRRRQRVNPRDLRYATGRPRVRTLFAHSTSYSKAYYFPTAGFAT